MSTGSNRSNKPRFTFEEIYPSVFLITPLSLRDERGSFTRMFCAEEFKQQGLETRFVQHNSSFNIHPLTFRGLHAQSPPFQEVKIVRCIRGSILDLAVDPLKNKYVKVLLSEQNNKMLYIPKGFLHGYLTLKPNTEVFYLSSNYYSQNHEINTLWNKKEYNIQLPLEPRVLSTKDSHEKEED